MASGVALVERVIELLKIPPILASPAPISLSNGLREAFLQQDQGKGLLVVEGLLHLKIRPNSWLTFKQIFQLLSDNFGMSHRTVYEGLREHPLVFERRVAARQPHQRGAPAYEYRLPHPDELEAEFAPGLGTTPSDALQKADLRSLSAYRMGLHHQLFIRKWCEAGGKGFVMYRDLMAQRLGVSVRTIRTYDQKLGHDNDPNYREEQITGEAWKVLPRYKNKQSATGSRQWLKVYDPETDTSQSYPLVKFLAYRALKDGQEVYKVERLANTYYPYRRPDPRLLIEHNYDPVYLFWADQEAREAAGLFRDAQGCWYHQRE